MRVTGLYPEHHPFSCDVLGGQVITHQFLMNGWNLVFSKVLDFCWWSNLPLLDLQWRREYSSDDPGHWVEGSLTVGGLTAVGENKKSQIHCRISYYIF